MVHFSYIWLDIKIKKKVCSTKNDGKYSYIYSLLPKLPLGILIPYPVLEKQLGSVSGYT